MGKNSNESFFKRYGRPGCVGLVGGTHWSDRVVRKAQRFLMSDGKDSLWSHVFIFEGTRLDEQPWILESDMDLQKKFLRLGVQENHLARFFNEKLYPNVAVLDFNLSPAKVKKVLSEGL